MRCLALFVLAVSAYASADPFNVQCVFETYVDPTGLNEEVLELEFIIDPDNEKFYSVGNNGVEEVTLIMNDGGFSLIEVTPSGNVMVTAITNNLESVHSRHSMVNGQLVPSQFYGTCL